MAIGLVTLVGVVIAVTAGAERLRLSPPLVLMLVGAIGSFVPFIPDIELTPEIVLIGLLPPLLYSAAIRISVIDFRANKASIGFLSVLLVLITAFGIGLITWLILPIPFALAVAFGAVVAPPDAVAATSIARRVGLPRRVVTILEGESLVNDATAITALRVSLFIATTAAGAGRTPGGLETAGTALLGLVIAAGGGVLVGLVVAWVAALIRRRIHKTRFDTAFSLLVPFLAYLPAEELGWGDYHASGVVAVVLAGLILGHKAPVIQTARSRISERTNWNTIQFVLENSVFLLIGLQVRRIVADLQRTDLALGTIVGFCAAVLVGVIVLRLLWVGIAGFYLFRAPSGSISHQWAKTSVIGWAGMRGVVTLAAAFVLPDSEIRPVLVFAALVVTVGTLLIQGLSLPWVARRSGLRGPDAREDALQAASVLQSSTAVALQTLDDIRQPHDTDETLAALRRRIDTRTNSIWERLGAPGTFETPAEAYRRLRLATLEAERGEVLRIRSAGTIESDVIAQVLASLDQEESMLMAFNREADGVRDTELAVRTPAGADGSCEHLDEAPTVVRPLSRDCEDCIREGTRPVHLRLCLTCGNVGCCDSSVGKHATRHFHDSRHPVMRSFEQGESWRWCYVDERLG
ncbi:CPA1 family monovalent cation:H+ antiporter [Friedmanniella endophytica]|uniref:CPA1 family monovalent cation:H+ antiporter n=1 Tax=Microlunatus kandeliicorticis TaxID=1759536 RepID=A0A7W3IQ88_9ACTN|nr:cation:proton antiporter [Microlunatus kandeliicorticis]MBA8793264.1 CPA1 family monovalent cation:H+ antiporter [Microlunatus kandeliicorticis]